ncbi:MAG: HEPN domain-containing protein [Pyrobaculum sp.]|uniref:HEPN domain-containing protein n=1 Tax=Pyrobaculum sp. TaxID=2004705 RepID=UPI00315F557A
MRREASLWLKQAEGDLKKAENDPVTGDWDGAAFRSQQAAEKALKALLPHYGKVARGHNLIELGRLVEEELGISTAEVATDLRELTVHYVISRYPNAANALPYELYDESKARDLVERAKRVLDWARRNLR